MWARRCLRTFPLRGTCTHRAISNVKHDIDAYGIPIKPTWSVHELLSSYPTPTISPTTLARLHELSALIAPANGTTQHEKLKREMEELIRLVEAVKMVDTADVNPIGHQGKGQSNGNTSQPSLIQEVSGQPLLRHAARTSDDFYIVDADRKR